VWESKESESSGSSVLGPCLVFLREKCPDLAELVGSWETLPEPLRAVILAMIRSARQGGSR